MSSLSYNALKNWALVMVRFFVFISICDMVKPNVWVEVRNCPICHTSIGYAILSSDNSYSNQKLLFYCFLCTGVSHYLGIPSHQVEEN